MYASIKSRATDATFESMGNPVKPNPIFRSIWTAIFIPVAALVSACAPEVTTPAPLCAYLPEPAISRVDRGPLALEAALRKCEADKLVAERYRAQGYRIVATTQTYSGQIIDWMAAESVPGCEEPPPPPIDLDDLHLPPGVQLGKTELEVYPELQGPVGTVPVARTTFTAYVGGETEASSLEELLEQSEPQAGVPVGQDRLYTGYGLHMHSVGVVSHVNAFSGPPIEPETFSLTEMAVLCADKDDPTTGQLVGITASRDHVNFFYDDEYAQQLRLQVEFYTQGPNVTGPDEITGEGRGGWHGAYKPSPGFVPKSTTTAFTGGLLQASVVGGPQYEHRFEIQLYQGNWWLAHNDEWFGYYPGSLFMRLQDYSCDLRWYTEVYDNGKVPGWTWTDGGSGEFAAAGFDNVAGQGTAGFVTGYGLLHDGPYRRHPVCGV
jgi:hypothetical protein